MEDHLKDGMSAVHLSCTFRSLIRSRGRTQEPAEHVTLPLGQRAEVIYHPRDPLPVVIGKLILSINAGRPRFRRVFARTAG